ncbi:MAG: PhaM family polyhydroxyalkanoate granule multifunctional regulatory protein [Leptothrix ochracea]|uniref:PhaM family polyhydroxyalkanoate granule multifunctional regulatory protein n=1 Tax=Leptothrix ochracea TaxID=735331 RepID=UPI0034E2D647
MTSPFPSMPPMPDFAKMVTGFDFLQSLMKNASTQVPGVPQWVAPTLDPEELDRRIHELRTVQFWLEQNVRMLGSTIQALEVQRMTLSTLKGMNVAVGDLQEALKVRMPEAASTPSTPPSEAAASGIDPMPWWQALTQQFSQIVAQTQAHMTPPATPSANAEAQTDPSPAAEPAAAAKKTTPRRKAAG